MYMDATNCWEGTAMSDYFVPGIIALLLLIYLVYALLKPEKF